MFLESNLIQIKVVRMKGRTAAFADLSKGRFGSFSVIRDSVGPMAASAQKAATYQARFSLKWITGTGQKRYFVSC